MSPFARAKPKVLARRFGSLARPTFVLTECHNAIDSLDHMACAQERLGNWYLFLGRSNTFQTPARQTYPTVTLVVGNVAGDFLIDRRRAWRTSRLCVRPHDSNVFGVICTPADETECHTLRHLQKPFEQFAYMVHILVDKY